MICSLFYLFACLLACFVFFPKRPNLGPVLTQGSHDFFFAFSLLSNHWTPMRSLSDDKLTAICNMTLLISWWPCHIVVCYTNGFNSLPFINRPIFHSNCCRGPSSSLPSVLIFIFITLRPRLHCPPSSFSYSVVFSVSYPRVCPLRPVFIIR